MLNHIVTVKICFSKTFYRVKFTCLHQYCLWTLAMMNRVKMCILKVFFMVLYWQFFVIKIIWVNTLSIFGHFYHLSGWDEFIITCLRPLLWLILRLFYLLSSESSCGSHFLTNVFFLNILLYIWTVINQFLNRY